VAVTQHAPVRLSTLDMEVVRSIPPGGNWRDVPLTIPSRRLAQIRVSAARGEGSRSTYYGRLRWDQPAYTINTYYHRPGNGCTIHPEVDRMLTDREVARLQTFPDYVRFAGPMRARQIQIGNAVPPLLAYHLATEFLESSTVVDLFAGAGGLSLGAELAGHDIILGVDNDRYAAATLASLHGEDRVLLADLDDPTQRERIVERVKASLNGEQLGVLMGGPPCQGFSTAGACLLDDPRNNLLVAFIEIAEALTPRSILIENVTGLLFRGRALLEEAIERLEKAGYTCDWAVLHAEAYGVPQRRRRLFVRAELDGEPSWPAPVRATAEPSFRRLQPRHLDGGPSPATVRDAIAGLGPPAADSEMAVDYVGPPTGWLDDWLRAKRAVRNREPAAAGV